jgi:hypothetical protein
MAYNFPADWKSGFVMDPVKKQRVGYITDFNGLGLTAALAKDLNVFCPYNNAAAPSYTALGAPAEGKVSVTAVLENVSWGGGVGDAFTFSCYMSSENANLLKALKQMTLKTTSITTIGWWIANFDEETKVWFEEHYPKAPVKPTGQLNAVSKNDIRLHIADEPVKVAPNIDVNVYNVYFEMVPAANQTATYTVSSSASKTVVLPWGLVVGTLAKAAVAPGT